jgi:uncharacterized membrane protein
MRKTLLRGFIALLPISITIYVIYWLVTTMEGLLGSVIQKLTSVYVPGLGFILTILMIYSFGLLLNNYIAKKSILFIEESILKIPVVKAIYSPLKELMNLFSRDQSETFGKVVLLKVGPGRILGLVTRETFSDLKLPGNSQDLITVFVPMSYGLGGYTMLVHRNQVEDFPLTPDRALSLALTGWVKAETKQEPHQSDQGKDS